MRLWIDTTREAPKGWIWCTSIADAKDAFIELYSHLEEISLAPDQSIYIDFLDWVELLQDYYPNDFNTHEISIHNH